MTFVQIIDCKTDARDEMNRLMDIWVEQTRGKRTATHSIVAQDRADDGHIVEIVEFPSYEDAMRNSDLPETTRVYEQLRSLCEEPPRFTDLDVVRDEQLNKDIARRFYEHATSGALDELQALHAEDYVHHDPSNREDIRGPEGVRQEVSGYRAAFDFAFTVDGQIAEGDTVATRWTWNATHRGDFRDVPATGARCSVTGTTTHRIRDRRIAESWWNWDTLGLLRQLGVVEV
jgi:steroid delta-isomerase-like uncharacterized protein